jgi:hypothetical protein
LNALAALPGFAREMLPQPRWHETLSAIASSPTSGGKLCGSPYHLPSRRAKDCGHARFRFFERLMRRPIADDEAAPIGIGRAQRESAP